MIPSRNMSSDLTMTECNHMICVWKICFLCGNSITEDSKAPVADPFRSFGPYRHVAHVHSIMNMFSPSSHEQLKKGCVMECLCIRHEEVYACPGFQSGDHQHSSCSICFKQRIIINYVVKTFDTDDVRSAYKKFIETSFPLLLKENSNNYIELGLEECKLLVATWRICYRCQKPVTDEGGQIDNCGCFHHSTSCLLARSHVRLTHPRTCTVEFKQANVAKYVRETYNTDNLREAYRHYMRKKCPLLLKESVSQSTPSLPRLPSSSSSSVSAPEVKPARSNASSGYVSSTSSHSSGNEVVHQIVVEHVATRTTPLEFDHVDVVYFSELKIIRPLAVGGQGTVELASNEFYTMAVKRLQSCFNSNNLDLKRELINTIKVSHHPNLVQIRGLLYQSPEANSFPIGYAMEYLPEGSLYDVIHSSPPVEYGLQQVFNWTKQASSALHYLHGKRIIHRDVKPSNMLLDRNHQVLKLCDLGLSNNVQTMQTATRGTFLYMAPEVSSSEESTVQYSESCDVYSLAVSIWEMYHRKVPFDNLGTAIFRLLSHVSRGTRPEIAPDCDPELSEMIQRAWSPVVTERPTMRDIHSFALNAMKKFPLGVDI